MRTQSLVIALVALLATSCSDSGGGDGGGGTSGIRADVPTGSGQVAIDMAGTWRITNARLVDANDPNVGPPANGTPIELSAAGLVGIAGDDMSRAALESGCGCTLDYYVNQCDGRTILFGFSVHDPATGEFVELGWAAGALTNDSIAVATYARIRLGGGSRGIYARSRYELVRAAYSRIEGDAVADDGPRASIWPRLLEAHGIRGADGG